MNSNALSTAASTALAVPNADVASQRKPSLSQLLEDGFYLLFLLRNDATPQTFAEFDRRVQDFLQRFERTARQFGKDNESVEHAKYAFCALMDEVILGSDFPLRSEWERAPLQLRLFGDHLAGERFFDKLELLRLDPNRWLEALEVFHICLLLGFSGKYLIEGPEKLQYLRARVGQEVTSARGGPAAFSPHWKPPHAMATYVRSELPLWLFFGLIALVTVAIFGGFAWLLDRHVERLGSQQRNEPSPYETSVPAAPAPVPVPTTGAAKGTQT